MRMRVFSFTYICANPELYSFGEGNWFQFFVAYINPNSLYDERLCEKASRSLFAGRLWKQAEFELNELPVIFLASENDGKIAVY